MSTNFRPADGNLLTCRLTAPGRPVEALDDMARDVFASDADLDEPPARVRVSSVSRTGGVFTPNAPSLLVISARRGSPLPGRRVGC